jgi:hypothetical protein
MLKQEYQKVQSFKSRKSFELVDMLRIRPMNK